jgi:hypothetical protein
MRILMFGAGVVGTLYGSTGSFCGVASSSTQHLSDILVSATRIHHLSDDNDEGFCYTEGRT